MVEVKINDGENFEGFLRRFTKKVQQESIISEARRRQHFESASVVRKKNAATKKRKSMKTTQKNMLFIFVFFQISTKNWCFFSLITFKIDDNFNGR